MFINRLIESNFLTVASNDSIISAIALMKRRKQSSLSECVLVLKKGCLVGIVTQKDVVKAIAEGLDIATTTVDRVMSFPVFTIAQSQCENIQSVWHRMQQHSVNYLPVLAADKAIVGVISAKSLYPYLKPLKSKLDCHKDRKNTESERFFDFNPSIFCIAGFDGYFKRINLAFSQILGFSEKELFNEPFINFVHPDDRPATITEFSNLQQGNTIVSFENRYRTKKGDYRWFLWTAKPYLAEQKIYAAARDITERKKTELQLKQERDFSQAVINTVGALVAVLDHQGKIISFNRTCEQITGYQFAEIRGQKIWDVLIVPEEKATLKAVFKKLLAGQVPNQYTNYWLAKDGNAHLISWSNTALFDNQGKVEFIVATGIDTTEQRQVWNKLEHQYRQTNLIAEITRKIRMSIEIEEILQTAVNEVQHLLNCDRVLIVEIRSNNTALPISEAVLPEFPSMVGYELVDPLLVGKHLTRYRQGKILAIDNVANSAIALEIKQLLKQFRIQAKLVIPILSQSQLKGLLVAHQCHYPRNWQEKEIKLLTQLADQIGVALSQAQLLNNLESMVKERTVELTTINQLLQNEITERKATEATLRENQEKLRGILDNADEAIISIDSQQQIQLFNQGAENIFGYKAAEIIGQSLNTLLPESFRNIHSQHVNRFGKAKQQSRTMAQRNDKVFGLRKNGEQFPAEASIAKLHTRTGILFTVMLKDITEQQQAKEKLQASQRLMAKAEKIAKIGSWEYNFINQKLSWSDELFEILGFVNNGSIPICEDIFTRIHPDDLLLVKNTLKKGHQQGKSWNFSYRIFLPDGTIKYLESRGEPTVDRQGQISKIWGTVMDISQRIEAEKSFQRSEEQLRLITDGLPVLIAYIDDRQRYLYNNRTYETWFGKSRSTLIGQKISTLYPQQDYQKMLPYIKEALLGKAVSFEIQSINEKQPTFWMNITYIPDFDANNQVKGFFSMIEDITERKQVEKMKSEFVSIASHEMRTPLTSIYGVVKLMDAGYLGELSPKGKKMSNLALKNCDRLIHLIEDILDLERIESGKEQIEKRLCNSQQLIQQAIETIGSLAKDHCIVEQNTQPIEFYGDSDRLVQTLTNLISNAVKFSPANSEILVNSQQQEDNILFTVQDFGRGIPQDKLETIFERFQQVDASDSRKKGGTGLGLAICRHIIQQHQGKIWAESVYGQGSTFFFTIPL